MCKSRKTPMLGLIIFAMIMMMIPSLFLILLSPQVMIKRSWDWCLSFGILLLWPLYHKLYIIILIVCQKPILKCMIPLTFTWLAIGHIVCLYLLLNATRALNWYQFPTQTENSLGKIYKLYYDRDDMWWIFVSFAFTWFSFSLQIAYGMHIRNLNGLTSFGCRS
ncbi:uncharacterized protein LOC26515575 [Drosophila ananassae]|uniref:uncharacterized protein LOC26515575 n=1 Tax=Drosophila ananassae TaxID=7217 RepID=UPI0013A5E480|nr:uncharacterized protein LOC26515575 [Drosophila ananassae]